VTTAPGFSIKLFLSDDGVLLRCAGEIDLSNVDLLRRSLDAHVADSSRELTVDLRGVSYLDSTAIIEIWRAAVVLIHAGQRLRVRVTPRQAKLFVLTQCDRVLALETAEVLIRYRSDREGSVREP
jgi:anti-anti-sigma factor